MRKQLFALPVFHLVNVLLRPKFLLFFTATFLLISCKKDQPPAAPTDQPVAPVPGVLLKEINIPNLPSPFYHFEYNADNKLRFASYASELTRYNLSYDGNRISELRNDILVNRDRLQYTYENSGKPGMVTYADSTGNVYVRIKLTYDGNKLVELKRERKFHGSFSIDKIMTMIYHADGNLKQLTDHRPAFNGQPELTFIDQFEQYDNKVNVDGFSLIHNEFFDHLVLLPGVQLQKNNPQKVTRTGSGVNYKIDYTYVYNDKNLPLTKKGALTFTNGTDAGKQFQTNSVFSYY